MRSNEPPEPVDPATLPPELQEALRKMSQRGQGPVVDLGTGAIVARDGHLAGELVACMECARAVALGWWGSIARHIGNADAPVCLLCCEGEAVLTAVQWFSQVAVLVRARIADGQRRTWNDDALIGLGIQPPLA